MNMYIICYDFEVAQILEKEGYPRMTPFEYRPFIYGMIRPLSQDFMDSYQGRYLITNLLFA